MAELYMQYGPALLLAIFTVIAWLFMHLLWNRIKDSKYAKYILRAGQELRASINEVSQTYVAELKAASEDGKLTDEEKKAALQKAIDKFKSNYGVKGLKRLSKILGLGDKLDGWLTTQAESMLHEMKTSLPEAKALPPKE